MIDPHTLDEILEVLRDRNVASFSCSEFSVTMIPTAPEFAEQPVAAAITEGNAAAKMPNAHGVFAHPSLWPSGKPPSFPKSERGE